MTVKNLVDEGWRTKSLTLEAWKAQCEASSHHHKGEELLFHEDRYGTVHASSIVDRHRSVTIGCYFTVESNGIKANTGWTHS